MIDSSYKGFYLVCDGCDLKVKCDTFGECVDYKKENGWRSEKVNSSDWVDYCPDCKEANNEG